MSIDIEWVISDGLVDVFGRSKGWKNILQDVDLIHQRHKSEKILGLEYLHHFLGDAFFGDILYLKISLLECESSRFVEVEGSGRFWKVLEGFGRTFLFLSLPFTSFHFIQLHHKPQCSDDPQCVFVYPAISVSHGTNFAIDKIRSSTSRIHENTQFAWLVVWA